MRLSKCYKIIKINYLKDIVNLFKKNIVFKIILGFNLFYFLKNIGSMVYEIFMIIY